MKVKGINFEDFVNYKKPSMFISFPNCSFKCDKECGRAVCQNSALALSPDIEISVEEIVERYINNPITKAIVCGGLEPFDSFRDLSELITKLREVTNDEIVIYTGYKEEEIMEYVEPFLFTFSPIIVKYGRFIPDCESYLNEVLGVKLASPNQYAKRY